MSLDLDDLQAALLDEMLAPSADGFTDADLARMLGQFNGQPATMFFGPTRPGVARTLPGANPVANRLMRWYPPVTEGVNVYILNDGTVTVDDPGDDTLVRRVLWGAHYEPVTAAEAALLTAAGYGGYLS